MVLIWWPSWNVISSSTIFSLFYYTFIWPHRLSFPPTKPVSSIKIVQIIARISESEAGTINMHDIFSWTNIQSSQVDESTSWRNMNTRGLIPIALLNAPESAYLLSQKPLNLSKIHFQFISEFAHCWLPYVQPVQSLLLLWKTAHWVAQMPRRSPIDWEWGMLNLTADV